MLNQNKPRVLVLMASYNGLQYIDTQINSIAKQVDCEISLLISVDMSDDNTFYHLQDLKKYYQFIKLLDYGAKYGSAANNFYRLIIEANLHDYDFIAFADQDDIWNSDKLIRHIELAKRHGADGVSSNVTAFWPNGRKKLIDKAQTQTELDCLFESAGPGCTFLMTSRLVSKIREQLLNECGLAKKITSHDWLTYAICRAHGYKWAIDTVPSVMYRQHQSNVVGANSGLKAKLIRIKKLKKGWYRGEVIKICEVSASISKSVEVSRFLALLRNKSIISQYKLLPYALKGRRKFTDRLLLVMSIALFVF